MEKRGREMKTGLLLSNGGKNQNQNQKQKKMKMNLNMNVNMNVNLRPYVNAGAGRLPVKWWGLSGNYQSIAGSCPSSSSSSSSSPFSSSSALSLPGPVKGKYWSTWNMMTLVWSLAGAGLVVAAIVYHFFSREHYQHFEDMLVNMCDERARMLQHQFGVSMNHVHALAILVSTFHLGKQPSALDKDTFAEYAARTGFERPLMTGVAYAHKVLHSEREEFERLQGWRIKNMHTKEPSPLQDEYAPTVFSQETLGYLVSLDMMSGQEDRENIIRARTSGKGVLTSPLRLLESNHLGVVLTFAVYDKDMPSKATPEERIEATAGYLGGAFDVESLVENLLRQLAKNEAIIVNVYDITNNSMPLAMYGPDPPDSSFAHVSPLDFGDPYRKHEMRCRLARETPPPKLAIGFASGVLALVSLICFMVYNAYTHVKKVEEDYRKMEELKAQAEAADIAKSQFLATVSHEIRTPMNGVLGMLQLLMDTNLHATQQDYARTAHASGKALITLINEVLDQAKIESGRIELEAVPFDLRAILDDVLSLFSGKTRNKGIELAVFVSEWVPNILIGDPGRFRQIITNLVGNSVKFTEKGHIFVCVHLWEDIESIRVLTAESFSKESSERRIKRANELISCSYTLSGSPVASGKSSWEAFRMLLPSSGSFNKADSGNRNERETEREREEERVKLSECVKVFISVEDTGVGIPAHAQQRIFMPFMQADSSTSRTYGGTGIGLSISRCLVELMNGEMGFESVENIGSTFTCSLLLKRWDPNSSAEDPKQPDPLPTKFQGMKALVIDGRRVRSEVTKYHLRRLGIQVITMHDSKAAAHELLYGLSNGVTAVEHSAIQELNMVIVDKDAWGASTGLNFPSLLLKEQEKQGGNLGWRTPKLILVATSMNRDETEKAKTNGYVDTVIMKPLRASMIAACLQQALGLGVKGHQGRGLSEDPTSLRNLLYGKNILVVDDNGVNRQVAAGALKKYGANVKCAESGKSAIELLWLPHKFDACFMDIQMPEMDGFEATKQIRRLEQLGRGQMGESEGCTYEEDNDAITNSEAKKSSERRLPILAMTADVIQATHDECIRCGMDGYVSKPFEEKQLYQAVAKFFIS